MKKINLLLFIFLFLTANSMAAKLVKILPVDNQCLVIHWQDGMVEYNWDDTISGSCNGWNYYYTENWHLCPDKDQYIPFGQPLNTSLAQQISSFSITSEDDLNYGKSGMRPVKISRKSKVWEAAHDEQKPVMHHWIYLELPSPMQRGKSYRIEMDENLNAGEKLKIFNYDEFYTESPSIKISNIGYEAGAVHKSADLYLWMGDGGGRDFSRFTGTEWHLFDIKSETIVHSGKLAFRMKNKPEPELDMDFTGADVWECDFSEYTVPGNYRLVIEGIGSSPNFIIDENRFDEAFKVSMQGMFYQRMGCAEKPAGDFPYSRRPLFKQGVEPEDFKVYISKKNMVTGNNPDERNFYSEELTGEIAKATWGGWSDAYDNDQRPVNFICVFDILLTYYLNPQAFSDNQLYIPETGNGIPDIIDEALWEIDWWLRMRDSKGGYLTGLTNILPPEKINYAGAPCAWQGWCVAASTAMAADCFRLAGNKKLQKKYTDAAREAYNWALNQADKMLSTDVSGLRGKDLKMTAAAFLYNLTGEKSFETEMNAESEVQNSTSKVRNPGKWEQQFAAVAYLFTPQKVNYPELKDNMKKAIINQAKNDYLHTMNESPTKAARWTVKWEGMAQTSNEMSLVAVAHKLTESQTDKAYFEKGMYAEAEWTLGRNPLGLVQMTGLGDRSFTQTFAPGRRDGYPNVTPGWTPYMCRDGWANEDDIHKCEWYTNRNYPEDKEIWPWGEHFWNSRYSVPNSETTPQQTFRQKIMLYGYLYGIKINENSTNVPVVAGDQATLEKGLISRDDIIFFGGFEQGYNNDSWKNRWGIPWMSRAADNEVVTNGFQGGKSLRVKYPKGGVGPGETGGQFPMVFRNMEGLQEGLYHELYLRYYLKFEEGFDFNRGGKLPGLMGSGDSWGRSGGNQPDGTNGWTLRFMWRSEGKLVIYAYVPKSSNGKWGNDKWGQDIDCDFKPEPGRWHCIEQFVNVGSPGNDDGKLTVWIDGIERLNIDDMRFWYVENEYGSVGGIYFSTFHGGNSADWAPRNDSFAQFDGIVAAKKRVGGLIVD